MTPEQEAEEVECIITEAFRRLSALPHDDRAPLLAQAQEDLAGAARVLRIYRNPAQGLDA